MGVFFKSSSSSNGHLLQKFIFFKSSSSSNALPVTFLQMGIFFKSSSSNALRQGQLNH